MAENRKFKCMQASFRKESSDWERTVSGGYLTVEPMVNACRITFTDTGNLGKKATHVAVESKDMAPDAAMLTAKVAWETVKSYLGMGDGASRRRAAQSAQKNADSLQKKYEEHKSNNFHLDQLEKALIRFRLTKRSVVEYTSTKAGTSVLVLRSYTIEKAQNDRSRYEVCHFVFNNASDAKALADIIKSNVPFVTIRKL